jgi:hypothetical protein
MVVEVRHVLGQHCGEMAAVDDEDPVEQFAAGGSDPSFGDRICPGCPHRCAQDAKTLWVPNKSSRRDIANNTHLGEALGRTSWPVSRILHPRIGYLGRWLPHRC